MLTRTDVIRLKGIVTTLRNMNIRGREESEDAEDLESAAAKIEAVVRKNPEGKKGRGEEPWEE